MCPDWPLLEGARNEDAGSSGTDLIALTAPGSTNTKGAWAQLVASTSFDVAALIVESYVTATGSAAPQVATDLIDIGIGAAGSEQVVVPNLTQHIVAGSNYGITRAMGFVVPLLIPAGSRLAARYQGSTISSNACRFGLKLFGQGFMPSQPPSRVLAWGADTAVSRGTDVDPGTTANTKGTYVQLAASTEADVVGIMLGVGNRGSSSTSGSWLIDVAVGAGGSEQIVLPSFYTQANSGEVNNSGHMFPVYSGFVPVSIPAGSRVAARAQSSNNGTGRTIDAVVYGLVA